MGFLNEISHEILKKTWRKFIFWSDLMKKLWKKTKIIMKKYFFNIYIIWESVSVALNKGIEVPSSSRMEKNSLIRIFPVEISTGSIQVNKYITVPYVYN